MFMYSCIFTYECVFYCVLGQRRPDKQVKSKSVKGAPGGLAQVLKWHAVFGMYLSSAYTSLDRCLVISEYTVLLLPELYTISIWGINEW